MQIPVTVFTGFLGSGKTTVILNLIKQLPSSYKMVVLKNEFGNIAVDSQLFAESNIQVTEMLNGCLCCILVGKLGNALTEILNKYQPDRIIIETSGSAYPAPIAWEIRKMSEQLKLDGIITVIDAINFPGYADSSYTAKIQAECTDLILINKHEDISPEKLDKVLDDVYDLNPSTPKIKTKKGFVDQKLLLGIDTKLFTDIGQDSVKVHPEHHAHEVELMELHTQEKFSQEEFLNVLKDLPKWDFFRIKGAVMLDNKWQLLNYAFGKFELTELSTVQKETALLIMGKNFQFHFKKLPVLLNLKNPEDLKLMA